MAHHRSIKRKSIYCMFSLIKAPVNVSWSTCYMKKTYLYVIFCHITYKYLYTMKRQRYSIALTLKKSVRMRSVLKCFLLLHCRHVVILSQCSALEVQWIEPVSSTFVERSAHFDSGRLLYIDLSKTQAFNNLIQTEPFFDLSGTQFSILQLN